MDSEFTKHLNFFLSNPDWAYCEESEEKMLAIKPDRITKDGETYWLGGTTTLNNGKELGSVFVIQDGGAELMKVYWHFEGQWHASDDAATPAMLGLNRSDIFPFDWSYAVPVDNDIYHN